MFGWPLKYLLAVALFAVGVLLMGCGANVCWLRWRRGRRKSVDQLLEEDQARRRAQEREEAAKTR